MKTKTPTHPARSARRQQRKEEAGFWAHPTAVIDKGARIGARTKVWHFSHVMAGARIGPDCSLGQNVFVASHAVVGGGCKLQNNVSVYDGVVLGKEVFVGPSVVFTNVINPRAALPRRDQYRPTIVDRGASIGANATVVCGHMLGTHCFVAAGAVVTHDVLPYALVAGVPARRVGWMCCCGVTLPKQHGRMLKCGACGARYRRCGSGASEEIEPA